MKYSTRLFRAAKILDRDGWVPYAPTGRAHCVVTAISSMGDGYIERTLGLEVCEVIFWNDNICRNGNEAAMLLEFGGHYLRSEGL